MAAPPAPVALPLGERLALGESLGEEVWVMEGKARVGKDVGVLERVGAGVRVSLGEEEEEGVAEEVGVGAAGEPVGCLDSRAELEEVGVEVGEGRGPLLPAEVREGRGEVV